MNLTLAFMTAAFVVYDLIALASMYKSYGFMTSHFKENTGRSCSPIEKAFLIGMSIIVGILWLPLAILSILASKL